MTDKFVAIVHASFFFPDSIDFVRGSLCTLRHRRSRDRWALEPGTPANSSTTVAPIASGSETLLLLSSAGGHRPAFDSVRTSRGHVIPTRFTRTLFAGWPMHAPPCPSPPARPPRGAANSLGRGRRLHFPCHADQDSLMFSRGPDRLYPNLPTASSLVLSSVMAPQDISISGYVLRKVQRNDKWVRRWLQVSQAGSLAVGARVCDPADSHPFLLARMTPAATPHAVRVPRARGACARGPRLRLRRHQPNGAVAESVINAPPPCACPARETSNR